MAVGNVMVVGSESLPVMVGLFVEDNTGLVEIESWIGIVMYKIIVFSKIDFPPYENEFSRYF